MTVKETAHFLRVSPSYVYKLVRLNKVPYLKIGSKVLFDISDLDSFMESRKSIAKCNSAVFNNVNNFKMPSI